MDGHIKALEFGNRFALFEKGREIQKSQIVLWTQGRDERVVFRSYRHF